MKSEEHKEARNLTSVSVVHSGEAELVRALQAGDREALIALFDRYYLLVLTAAMRILNDIAEAEDVMQLVFFESFHRIAQFDPAQTNLGKWILQNTYRRSIDRKNGLEF